MSEAKKVYNTTDPILLEALHAVETAAASIPPKARRSDGSPYRGIGRKSKDGRWRAEVGANGRNFNLGYYQSDHEAALARNYGESLVPGAKKVNNPIPPGTVTPEVQKKIAAEVVARLRGYGVLPSVERNGEEAPTASAGPEPPKAPSAPAKQPETPEAQNQRLKMEIEAKANANRKGA